MNDKTVISASKKLSWLLRHGAHEAGLSMDADGWADIADVLRIVRLPRVTFDQAVAHNDKKRFEVDGERVRACQGHSAGVVSTASMEESWTELARDAGLVWHGTALEAIDGIAREGIVPVSRTHVHLAEATDSTVGKRSNVAVLLGVSIERMREAGEQLWSSPNGVVLARRVPTSAIVTVRAASRRGELELTQVRAKLSLRE